MSTWTKDKPTPGKWWVSIAPEKRDHIMTDVMRFYVIKSMSGDLFAQHPGSGVRIILTDPCFDGAQWKPVEPNPADPFAEQPRDNSRDSDLP